MPTSVGNISKIVLPSGNQYDIMDEVARAAIAGGVTFIGVTTTPIADGDHTAQITVDGTEVDAANGWMVFYGSKEFIFAKAEGAAQGTWHEFGDLSTLGSLAYKNSASGDYTPAGTVSQPTFTGTADTIAVDNISISGTVSQPTFAGDEGNLSVSGTPNAEVTISVDAQGTTNYTPAGTVSQPTTTVELNDTTIKTMTSQGALPQYTAPTWSASVQNETLTFSWDDGDYVDGQLPGISADITVATGVKSAVTTQPTFTGTGTSLAASFQGTNTTFTGKFTPAGTVSQPTFNGTQATITVE